MSDQLKAMQTALAQQFADTGRMVDENPFAPEGIMPSDDDFASSAAVNATEIFSGVMSTPDRERFREQTKNTLRDMADVLDIDLPGSFDVSDEDLNEIILTSMVDQYDD